MSESLFDAFGVISPKGDTQKIPLDKVCPVGNFTQVAPDKNYIFEYKPLRRLLKNISRSHPIWIHGPSGCGKTELVRQVGARLKRPVHVISMGEETSVRELLGGFELKAAESKNGFETSFRYGALTQAMQEEMAIIVLDEFNMAPSTVAAQFNGILETGEVKIPETGELVRTADHVTFVVTANTPGGMDETGIYVGSQAQNGATRSRFSGLRVNYLPPEKEEKIITGYFPRINGLIELPETDKSLSSLMVQMAGATRRLVEDHEVSLPFTVRNLKQWADSILSFMDVGMAFSDAYFDMLSPSEQTAVSEVYMKTFGWRPEE